MPYFATPSGLRDIAAKHDMLGQAAHLFDYSKDGVQALLFQGLRSRILRPLDDMMR